MTSKASQNQCNSLRMNGGKRKMVRPEAGGSRSLKATVRGARGYTKRNGEAHQTKPKCEVGTMNKTQHVDDFEQTLLNYVETCYSVALALTCDPYEARDLTRNVLTWAWRSRDKVVGRSGIKRKLLAKLRETFLRDYRMVEPVRFARAAG